MRVKISLLLISFLGLPTLALAQDNMDDTRSDERRQRRQRTVVVSDGEESTATVETRQLEHADANEIARVLRQVVPECPPNTRCRGDRASQRVVIEPVEDTNQLVIRGVEQSFEIIDQLISELDTAEASLSLVWAQWRVEPQLARTLARTIGDLASVCGTEAPDNCTRASSERLQLISIAIEVDSGQVIAFGDEEEIEELTDLLDSLDD